MSNFEKDAKNMTGTVAKEGYEASVGARALARAGKCPNLKGHVHEQIFCDKFNMNPRNILEGNHAQLTKSTTAKMKDVVVLNKKGQVVKHFQLKDTTSSSGVAKTSKQIIEKHYGKTKVMGTEETAKKVADKIANKTNQKIHSTNISTKTTTRIADKALGKMPTAAALRSAAKSGGVSGAVCGAGIEAVSSVIDVVDGKKDVDDALRAASLVLRRPLPAVRLPVPPVRLWQPLPGRPSAGPWRRRRLAPLRLWQPRLSLALRPPVPSAVSFPTSSISRFS